MNTNQSENGTKAQGGASAAQDGKAAAASGDDKQNAQENGSSGEVDKAKNTSAKQNEGNMASKTK